MLPEIKKIKELPIYTPTKWQTVILRNYGLVGIEKIAEVLNCLPDTVLIEAKRLGIEKIEFSPKWQEKGYITIIKNNWHLLPYEQIILLLKIDETKLDFILKEDDFLSVKLGYFKPFAEKVVYSPLNRKEVEETEKLAEIIRKNFIDGYAKPFDFYPRLTKKKISDSGRTNFDKVVYSYSTVYGDTLYDGGEIISDETLSAMSEKGINGIWIQGLLSNLEYYPFKPSLSKGYKTRQDNLSKLIEKCGKYNIKVFLYFNEPRALTDEDFTEKTENLKGQSKGGLTALCTSNAEVKKYLYEAVKNLLTAVVGIEGIITITMSENLTNCYSQGDTDCKVCKNLKRWAVVSEVNNILCQAAKDSGSKTRIIANLWGWAEYMGWSKEEVFQGINALDGDVEVLCVSEFSKKISKCGVESVIGEYSVSNVGPSKRTEEMFAAAKKSGHKIWAKVQVNNSWEFAVIPYTPVFDLVKKHIENLKENGVESFMLSWTLGGYPSVTIDLVDNIFSHKAFDYDLWLKKCFEENSDSVKRATELFSEAFSHYPYCTETVYFGAQQMGAANLLYAEKTGLKSTMVTFPYDDIESWRGIYNNEQFLTLMSEMTEIWHKGLQTINELHGNANFEDFQRYANTFYVNMKSMLDQYEFNLIKEDADRQEILSLLKKEYKNTQELYSLASEDCKIGYEASNHYYFTQNSFLEKFLCLECLLKQA